MSLSNSLGLLGRKVGMMRLFTDDGDAVPVTVVDVSNNHVTQVKTQRERWLRGPAGHVRFAESFACDQAEANHLAKAGVETGEIIRKNFVTRNCWRTPQVLLCPWRTCLLWAKGRRARHFDW